MEVLEKIKKRGFIGTIKAVGCRCASLINILAYYVFRIFPVNNKLIVMESEGDLSDNAYALYDYMLNNGYLERYKVVWLVDDVKEAKKRNFPNTTFVKKALSKVNFKRSYYLATCRRYIYDHCNLFAPIIKRKQQEIIYLCHGFAGYKAGKNSSSVINKSTDDFIIVTGEIPKKVLPMYRDTSKSKIVELGFSRLDYFYMNLSAEKIIVDKKYHFSDYKKVYLWMPTFRQSKNKYISEDYQISETKLPLLETYKDLGDFNEFLSTQNILVVLKTHHLQKKLPIFQKKYSNILFINDLDVQELGIQLYQFIPYTDALITDYSSISADYMLLDKPMIFILDDFEEYNKSRGIIPSNAMELMTGEHVYTINELKDSITDILEGEDKYKDGRRGLVNKFYKYADGNASKRILDYFEINK